MRTTNRAAVLLEPSQGLHVADDGVYYPALGKYIASMNSLFP
jgi:hypothetical protein